MDPDQELIRLKYENGRHKQKITCLESDLKTERKESQAIKNQNETLQKEVAAAKQLIQEQQKTVDERESQMEEWFKKNTYRKKQIKELENHLGEVSKRKEEYKATANKLKELFTAEKMRHKETRENFEKDLEAQKKKYNQLSSNSGFLVAWAKKCQRNAEKAVKEKEELEKTLAQNQTFIKDAEHERNSSFSELKQKFQSEIKDAEMKHQMQVESLERSHKKAMQVLLTKMEGKQDAWNKEKGQLTKALQEKRTEASKLDQTLQTTRQQFDDEDEEYQKLKKDFVELRAQKDAYWDRSERYKTKFQNKETVVKSLESQLEKLLQEQNERKKLFQEKETQLLDSLERTESTVSKEAFHRERLRDSLGKAEEDKKKDEETIATLKDQLQKCRNQLNSLEKERFDLETSKKAVEFEKLGLEDDVKRLNELARSRTQDFQRKFADAQKHSLQDLNNLKEEYTSKLKLEKAQMEKQKGMDQAILNELNQDLAGAEKERKEAVNEKLRFQKFLREKENELQSSKDEAQRNDEMYRKLMDAFTTLKKRSQELAKEAGDSRRKERALAKKYEKDVGDLDGVKSQYNTEVKKWSCEKEALKAEKVKMQREKDARIAILQRNVDAYSKERAALKDKVESQTAELKKKSEEVQTLTYSLKKINEKLTSVLEAKKEATTAFDKHCVNHSEKMKKLTRDYDDKLMKSQADNTMLQAQMKSIEEEAEKKLADAHGIQLQFETKDSRIAQLGKENRGLEEEVARRVKEAEAKVLKVKELNLQLDQARTQADHFNKVIQEKTAEIATQKARESRLQEVRSVLEQKQAETEKELQDLHRRHESQAGKLERIEKRLEAKASENAMQEKKLTELRNNTKVLEAEVADLRTAGASHAQIRSKLQKELRQSKSELETLKSSLEEMKTELAQKEKAIKEQTKKLEELNGSLMKSEDERLQKIKEMQAAQQELAKAKAAVEAAAGARKQAAAAAAEREEKIGGLERQQEQLQRQMKEQHAAFTSQYKSLQQQSLASLQKMKTAHKLSEDALKLSEEEKISLKISLEKKVSSLKKELSDARNEMIQVDPTLNESLLTDVSQLNLNESLGPDFGFSPIPVVQPAAEGADPTTPGPELLLAESSKKLSFASEDSIHLSTEERRQSRYVTPSPETQRKRKASSIPTASKRQRIEEEDQDENTEE